MTTVDIPKSLQISYADRLFFIGSCFSNEISSKFEYFGYQLQANPFGTVYNSRAILQQLQLILDEDFDLSPFLAEQNGQLISLLHNTTFQNTSKQALLEQIEGAKTKAKQFLLNSTVCFITLGTSWVFERNDKVVANCHKLPSQEFKRRLLSFKDIEEDVIKIHDLIQSVNPNIQLVFTVSPIRHTKDGLPANQISKAHILTALNSATEFIEFHYFPSYEIVLDELRDYRFYREDLVHLNQLGVEYVWQKVNDHWVVPSDQNVQKEVVKYRKLQQHRPSETVESQTQHKQQLIDLKRQLQKNYPQIELND